MDTITKNRIYQKKEKKMIEALRALRESEERFKAFMNNSPTVAFMKDSLGRFVYVNKTLERKFNIKFADLYLKTDFAWLPKEIAKQLHKNDLEVLSKGKTIQVIETVPNIDGCLNQWLVFKFPFQDSCGERLVGGVAIDITEQKLLEQELFEEKELAQVTLNSIGDAVITTDAYGNIKYLNPVAEKITGWSFCDAKRKPIEKVFRVINEINQESIENPVEEALSSHNSCLNKEYTLITRDGSEVAIDYSAAPICAKNGEVIGAVIVLQDVSHKRSIARQLSWQATHDALTRLLNRSEFERRLTHVLNNNTENHQNTLLFLDLDRFKVVNDTCGHIAGDELLQQVTALFQDSIRCSDTLARLGGDEFAILLESCPLDSALRIANNIVQRVQDFYFVWQGKSFNIGVSIGLVTIETNNRNITKLISKADTACYSAKSQGRNCVHVYQDNYNELVEASSKVQWVEKITQALQNNSFSLYYQPIVATNPNQSHSEYYEVLLRFIEEDGKEVLPMVFLSAAERYNLTSAIDRWVINKVCADITIHDTNCIYAINLFDASIKDEYFIDFVTEQLKLYQIPPEKICFEIAETIVMGNLRKATNLICALKELGCRLTLDNFGNSMSSWVYLKNTSVNYLKVDGSFIKHIVEDKIYIAMVEAINKIAHTMDMQTIAAYVETKEILDTVQAIGVDYLQGFGVAKPHPLFI
ncbi:MAG: EAL domain-containing protein [Calothrix sp. C42_A2020_038]|nr:EAL domain-containing protein [Calothrix sp. C42_A2020_038]